MNAVAGMQPDLDPASTDLLPGDILLLRSIGPLSDLIAWLSNSPYSHAELVAGGDELITAVAGSGVSTASLAERLAAPKISRIDAWRNSRLDSDADRKAVLDKARSLIGTGYAVDQLALAGLLMLVEDIPTARPLLRWAAAAALRYLIDQPRDGMVCSELVYRCFAECDRKGLPAGALAPAIDFPRPPNTTPFPADFDWEGLVEQIGHLLPAAHPLKSSAGAGERLALAEAAAPGEDELERLRQQARAQLGVSALDGHLKRLAGAPVNPREVAPQDLAASADTWQVTCLKGPDHPIGLADPSA